MPLTIIRFPLPGIIAAFVLDAVDQTVFQAFTSLELDWYEGYDKALDIHYLAIAYIATLRNWTNLYAFKVSRFLWYYRLVGAFLFELSQIRALLFVFPNTFEYFFDFIEAVRVRWDPRVLAPRLLLGAAAFIWIFIKLPQEYWLHIAQLDLTDVVQQDLFGVAPGTAWSDTFAARPWVAIAGVIIIVGFIWLAWWFITHKLPPATRRPTFDADGEPGRAVDPKVLAAVRARMANQLFDRELVEKLVLLVLVAGIFGQIVPGLDVAPLPFAIGIGVFVILNAAISKWSYRRGISIANLAGRFVATVIVNVGVLLVMDVVLRATSGGTIELQHATFMLLLLSLLITLYDRYRPEYEARFEATAARGTGAPV